MKLETIKIKGKDYVQVHTRIIHFRSEFKNWSLVSEIVHWDDEKVIIKASVIDSTNTIRATGHAMERFEGMINKNSGIENCETSAWGRALGNLGIGIDTAIRTFEEMIKEKPSWWPEAIKYLNDGGKIEAICKKYKMSDELKQELMDEAAS